MTPVPPAPSAAAQAQQTEPDESPLTSSRDTDSFRRNLAELEACSASPSIRATPLRRHAASDAGVMPIPSHLRGSGGRASASLEYEDAAEFSPHAAERDGQDGQAYDTSYDSMPGEWPDGNPEDDLPDDLSDGQNMVYGLEHEGRRTLHVDEPSIASTEYNDTNNGDFAEPDWTDEQLHAFEEAECQLEESERATLKWRKACMEEYRRQPSLIPTRVLPVKYESEYEPESGPSGLSTFVKGKTIEFRGRGVPGLNEEELDSENQCRVLEHWQSIQNEDPAVQRAIYEGIVASELWSKSNQGHEESFTTSTPRKPEKPKEKPKRSCTVRIDDIIDYGDPIPEKHADAEWIGPIPPEHIPSVSCETASTSNKKGKSKSATPSSASTTSGHAHSIQTDAPVDSEQSRQSSAAPMNEPWHASSQVPPNSFLGRTLHRGSDGERRRGHAASSLSPSGSSSSSSSDSGSSLDNESSSTSNGKKKKKKHRKHKSHSRRKHKGKSKDVRLRRPIDPKVYSGSVDVKKVNRFMQDCESYLEVLDDDPVRDVYNISRFLDGAARDFYDVVVSGNYEDWTLGTFFREMFDYCFPIDFREKIRKEIENCRQGGRRVKVFTHELENLYNVLGDESDRAKVVKLWKGLTLDITDMLSWKGFSQEVHSWAIIAHEAELAECYELLAFFLFYLPNSQPRIDTRR